MKKTKTYRANVDKYRQVEKLPKDAMTVADFAKQRGCTNSYIYHLIKRGKADFEIVIFKGINFVVTSGKKQ